MRIERYGDLSRRAKWSRRRSTTLSRLRGRFNAAPPFGGRSSSSLSQRRAPHRRHSCSSSPSSSPQTGQIWMVGAVMPLPLFSAEAKGAQVALAGDALHGEPARASPVASRCNLFWSSLVSLDPDLGPRVWTSPAGQQRNLTLRRPPVVAVRRAPVRREADRARRRAGDLPKMPAIQNSDPLPETPRSDEGCEEDLTGRRGSPPRMAATERPRRLEP